MITLVVEDYCHTCGGFEPEANKIFADNVILLTEVTCEYRNQCKNVARFVSERNAKGAQGE